MNDELRKQRDRTAYVVTNRQRAVMQRREELSAAWRSVAPQLIDIVSKCLPRSVVKVKFGHGTNEFKITGSPDGGFNVSMDSNMSLKILGDQVQFVEKDPAFQKIIYSSSVCDPITVVERGSIMFSYLILHWNEMRPMFEKSVGDYLKFWETLQN